MREIKFRGKRVDNREWVYGYYVKDNFGAHWIYVNGLRSTRYQVNPETVGQYIGIEDKSVKTNEIFEGDIIHHGLNDTSGETNKVIFDRGKFILKGQSASIDHILYDSDYFYVCGNKTDNPEI